MRSREIYWTIQEINKSKDIAQGFLEAAKEIKDDQQIHYYSGQIIAFDLCLKHIDCYCGSNR